MEFLNSLGRFLLGILARIYWLIPSLLSDPFDIAERWFGVNYIAPPNMFWILLLVGFFIASFLTYFHDIKGVHNNKQLLVLTPRTYEIGFSGYSEYPKKPDNADWLCLDVAVNPIDKPIDALDLLIDDKKIPANHWPGKNVAAFYAYFNITEWKREGNHQVELIAYVGDKRHRSGRKTIDFSVEVFTIHRI